MPRLGEDQQTGERVYARNDIDGGHLVRRASAVWGETREEAARANEDTFHYTNAAPQAAKFNQGLGLWLGLESPVGQRGRQRPAARRFHGPDLQ
ncbi:DNA/RNA non-specific endonuclease [Arthrobacter sp. Bi26]|uniref:DNA/RNA non-specific endonuclease n=1 Tax=Arthrobacter sp. Bi26 TaxID=2822350 RepID=UPI0033A514A3